MVRWMCIVKLTGRLPNVVLREIVWQYCNIIGYDVMIIMCCGRMVVSG